MRLSPEAAKLRARNSYAALRPYFGENSEPLPFSRITRPIVEFDDTGKAFDFWRGTQWFYGSPGGIVHAANQVAEFTGVKHAFHPPLSVGIKEDSLFYEFAPKLDAATGKNLMCAPEIKDLAPGFIYDVPLNQASTLIIFGLGLAHHVEALVDHYKIGTLILADGDLCSWGAALIAQDWQRLVKKITRRGIHFKLIYHPSPQMLGMAVINTVRHSSTAAIIGARMFLHHSAGEMGVIKQVMPTVGHLMGVIAGYFADEFRQVCQARENLGKTIRVMTRPAPLLPQDRLAVCVGSGPSLAKSFDLLRRIRDRVTLISCGTGFDPLVDAGFTPDAHVELETHPVSRWFYTRLQDLKVPVFLPVSFDPGSVDKFNDPIFFARESSTNTQLLQPHVSEVPNAFATVGNVGPALAVYLGFRHIAMLGMDCGYRPGDASHADYHVKGSAYDKDSADIAAQTKTLMDGIEIYDESIQKALTATHGAVQMKINSIDGHPLLASPVFMFALSTHCKLVETNPDRRLYQIGHGAVVLGATNAKPEDWTPPPAVKVESVAELVDRTKLRQDLQPIYEESLLECTRAVCDIVAGAYVYYTRPFGHVVDFIHADQAYITSTEKFGVKGPRGAAASMVRGTPGTYARAIMERAMLLPESERAAWVTAGAKLLIEMNQRIADLCSETFARG